MHFFKSNTVANKALLLEAQGLESLQQAIEQSRAFELTTPKVISVKPSQLSLEYIESARPSKAQWQALGRGLAKLHSLPQPHYGLNCDNFIGLSVQKNKICQDWGAFFIEYRLLFQANMIKSECLSALAKRAISENSSKITTLLNSSCQTASLVHGDLWSGNVMFSSERVYLIDPAIYFGDGEVDLAMSEMFGGFSPEFYQSYHEQRPISANYHDKKQVYNLYHYLNHYNLFGDSYLAETERLLHSLYKL